MESIKTVGALRNSVYVTNKRINNKLKRQKWRYEKRKRDCHMKINKSNTVIQDILDWSVRHLDIIVNIFIIFSAVMAFVVLFSNL